MTARVGNRPLEHHQELIDRFVGSFEKFDGMVAWDNDPVAQQLAVGGADQYGFRKWRARRVSDAAHEQLESIYAELPARFPPLFQQLVLSYRWAEISLGKYRLVENPPGADFSGLLAAMKKDDFMWNHMIRAGYIRFGKGPDMDYDPVCFDISSRRKNQDYRIVKLDHEEILCNERIKVVAELAPGFEELMVETVERASNLWPH